MTSSPTTNSVAIPEIIRVISGEEAKYEAALHGLNNSQWRYIPNREKLMGLEFRLGDNKTYYINHDIPDFEIELRMR